jgi:hypothetical protein
MHAVHGTFKVKEGMLRLDVASGKISGRIELEMRVAGTIRTKSSHKVSEL